MAFRARRWLGRSSSQLMPRANFVGCPPTCEIELLPVLTPLVRNPFPPGSRKLVGQTSGYRIRVGDYRVLYELQKPRLVVFVVKVGHRRDVYRR